MAKAKCKAYDDLYTSLEEKDGQLKAMRIAKQKNRESQDMCQVKQMKSEVGQVLLDEEEIKERWRSYFKQLMNVENDRNERVVEPGEETAVEEIKEEEVAAAMRRMKRGKAVGPDNIPVEAWKVLGWLGVEILTDMFAKIMETEKIPDEWRSSTLIPIFKNKGDIQECGNYRGIKLTSHTH